MRVNNLLKVITRRDFNLRPTDPETDPFTSQPPRITVLHRLLLTSIHSFGELFERFSLSTEVVLADALLITLVLVLLVLYAHVICAVTVTSVMIQRADNRSPLTHARSYDARRRRGKGKLLYARIRRSHGGCGSHFSETGIYEKSLFRCSFNHLDHADWRAPYTKPQTK